ncbi:MAG: oligosaccharide flippase family protein [Cyanobacteria bacterium J06573_11]
MSQSYKNYLKPSSILKFSSLNYLQSFLSFGASILIARTIGKDLYGEYALGLIFLNILSTINQFGSEKTLMRDLVHEDEPKSVLKAATYINLMVSAVTLSSVIFWLLFQDISGVGVVVVILFSLSGTCLGLSPFAWFDYKGRIHQQALILAGEKLLYLLSVGAILLLASRSHLALSHVALYGAGAFLCCRLLSAFQEWRFVFSHFEGASERTAFYVKKLLTSNVWIWLAVIGNLLMSQANQLMLRSQTSTAQLANYAIAFQFIMLIRLFQGQLMRLMAPYIADLTQIGSGQIASIRKKMHKCYGMVTALTLACVLPLFIAAPILINSIAGEQYVAAIPIFRILLMWISLYGVGLINNQFLIGFNLNRSFLIVTVTFGIISLFLAAALIPNYQGRGAALSLLIAHCGSIVTQVLVVEMFIYKMMKANARLST